MHQWTSAQEELQALRRSSARARCVVVSAAERDTPHGRRTMARVVCPDGWAAARLLLASAGEDARTPAARALALELLRESGGERAAFVRTVFDFVRSRVRFAREAGEVFARADYTLAAGFGDCDDHARVVYALLVAGGVPARLAFLYRSAAQGPTHVVAQAGVDGQWVWLETTVAAELGEHPYAAARRLGITREDIVSKVLTMTEANDLPPPPAGLASRTTPAQLALDVAALRTLGYLCDAPPKSVEDPTFRRAVLAFQRTIPELGQDGDIGAMTRGALAVTLRAKSPGEFAERYLATVVPTIGETVPRRLTAHLSDDFFRAIVKMARDHQARGATATAEDYLAVLHSESGLRSVQNHAGAPAYGLNQLLAPRASDGTYPGLRAVGFMGTPEEYLALDPADQVPYVARYFVNATGGRLELLRDASSLYMVNFTPAFIAHADDPHWVIAGKDGPNPGIYKENRAIDGEGKGWIEVSDLGKFVRRAQAGNAAYWSEALARLRTIEPKRVIEVPPIVIAVGVVGAGLLAWWVAGRA